MKFSAEQIAGLINGVIVGDSAIEVNSLAKIEEGKIGCLAYFRFAQKRSTDLILVDFVYLDFETAL